jgi:ribonuclease P protein component
MAGPLEMIRSVADFSALQAAARSRADSLLVLRYRRNAVEHTRFGISTGRRLGNAVVRNRVRRRLREVLRRAAPALPSGWDILVVCRPAAALASQAELAAALERVLAAAGLSEGGSSAP